MIDIAIKAAREGAKIAQEFYEKDKNISYKGNGDIVTNIDVLVENKIRVILQKSFPDHSFWGEEGGNVDKKSDYCWIVDPIEGTTNYVRKIGPYSISIGLTYKKESILGVVLNPLTNELFTAEKGKGAFLNGKKISVSNVSDLNHAIVYVSKLSLSVETVQKLLRKMKHIRVATSSAYDMCLVACGRIEGFIRTSTSPWGFPAAARIIEEAGGKVKEENGNGWNHKSKTLLLSNEAISKKLARIL